MTRVSLRHNEELEGLSNFLTASQFDASTVYLASEAVGSDTSHAFRST
jgi:hypothetical protein